MANCEGELKRTAVLARIIHEASTAASDPGRSNALRSVGLLDVQSSTPAAPSVARLVSTPVCAASLRTFMNNAGWSLAFRVRATFSNGFQ
jgi:hypothetical protein